MNNTHHHLSAKTIIRLMYELSKLIIIMGRYLGIYAKDSLDELLLITHQSSSYGGKSREVERRAVGEWIDKNINIKDEADGVNVAKILGHMSDDGEWITTIGPQGRSGTTDPKDEIVDEYTNYEVELGDNFPYIAPPGGILKNKRY
jgi:hypothetical protein